MKWRGRRTSGNIEDRRGGRMGGVSLGGGRLGIVGTVIVLLVGAYFGVDVSGLIGSPGLSDREVASGPNQINDQAEEFVGVVLADTEEVWSDLLAADGGYAAPRLVLFSGATPSGCGAASAAAGPFYCPEDQRIYLDTRFFRVLSEQIGATGDFAAAYVIAHEVGHHVQNLLGILPEVQRQRATLGESESNRLSVMVELQADCFAGAWARRAEARFGTIEEGDIDEALNAASRIGDDTLQENAGRAVVPDSFQHGTSEQRARWFRRGWESGDPNACDTFGTAQL